MGRPATVRFVALRTWIARRIAKPCDQNDLILVVNLELIGDGRLDNDALIELAGFSSSFGRSAQSILDEFDGASHHAELTMSHRVVHRRGHTAPKQRMRPDDFETTTHGALGVGFPASR